MKGCFTANSRCFCFPLQIVNQFLFLSAGSAALSKVEELAKEPVKITSYLAESLPAQSTFFICYIMLRSFTGLSLELLRVVDLIVIPVKRRWFCYTPREDEAAWRPPPIMYDRVVCHCTLFYPLTFLLQPLRRSASANTPRSCVFTVTQPPPG